MTEAARIIEIMGGHEKLAKDLEISESTVYRWTYPRAKQGTDGYIPAFQMARIAALAKARGIEL